MEKAQCVALDFEQLGSPPALDDAVEKSLVSETKTIDVCVDGETLKTFVVDVVKKDTEPKFGVLFLHGMRFSSQNWLDIKSVHQVANWGFRAVAVDLPGYGKTMSTLLPELNGEYISSLVKALGLISPVIVSPSMSGSFSLPYLFEEPKSSLDRCRGYIPVAPVNTGNFVKQYRQSKLPTLVLVGTKDLAKGKIGKVSTPHLMNLPQAEYAPIEDAGHACYLDNPDAFHKLLYYFLQKLQ